MNEKPKITVLITSSLIPSHPSIEVIRTTIESLKYIGLKKEDSKVLIALDVNPVKLKKRGSRYTDYKKNLQNYLNENPDFDYEITQKPKGGNGLVGNIMNAFSRVKAEYV